MTEQTVVALFDEIEKIGFSLPKGGVTIPGKTLQLRHLKYPLAIGGGVLGWEQLKKLKRRHDIGKMVEEQQRR